jgi:signal transduction histidine kinase
MIKRNIELEARLIDDLLDVTRITQGKLRLSTELIDAHAVVREAIELSQEEITAAGLSVSTALAASDHHVRGDGARLLQVLRNLLSNAIRHSPRGERIVIGSSNPRSGHVEVRVTDSGAGMTSDVLLRLFRPFEQGVERTGRGGGLGLGLAISRGIVEAHQGSIVAYSDGPGSGATFVATFPSVAGDGLDGPHDNGGRWESPRVRPRRRRSSWSRTIATTRRRLPRSCRSKATKSRWPTRLPMRSRRRSTGSTSW